MEPSYFSVIYCLYGAVAALLLSHQIWPHKIKRNYRKSEPARPGGPTRDDVIKGFSHDDTGGAKNSQN